MPITIHLTAADGRKGTITLPDPVVLKASLTVTSLIIPEGRTPSGLLVKSSSAIWASIAKALSNDWSKAFEIPPERWEEIVAGAFKNDGYDEVTLTPRSGDHGRDVIAIKRGMGCVKVLGSVKAFAPDRLVPYEDVRSLMGVIASERDTSKGIITTTSDFPPKIKSDPLIAPLLPTRIELVNGEMLQEWLSPTSPDERAAIAQSGEGLGADCDAGRDLRSKGPAVQLTERHAFWDGFRLDAGY
jgi:restriction system protein